MVIFYLFEHSVFKIFEFEAYIFKEIIFFY